MTAVERANDEAVALEVTGCERASRNDFIDATLRSRPLTTRVCQHVSCRPCGARATRQRVVRTSSFTADAFAKRKTARATLPIERSADARVGRRRENAEAGLSGALAGPDNASQARIRCRGKNLRKGGPVNHGAAGGMQHRHSSQATGERESGRLNQDRRRGTTGKQLADWFGRPNGASGEDVEAQVHASMTVGARQAGDHRRRQPEIKTPGQANKAAGVPGSKSFAPNRSARAFDGVARQRVRASPDVGSIL